MDKFKNFLFFSVTLFFSGIGLTIASFCLLVAAIIMAVMHQSDIKKEATKSVPICLIQSTINENHYTTFVVWLDKMNCRIECADESGNVKEYFVKGCNESK